MDKEKRLLAFLVVLLATSNFYWSFKATMAKPQLMPVSSYMYDNSEALNESVAGSTAYEIPGTNIAFALSEEFESIQGSDGSEQKFKGPNTVRLSIRTEEIAGGNFSISWKYVGSVDYNVENGWTLDQSEVPEEEKSKYMDQFEGMKYSNNAIRIPHGDAGWVSETLYVPDLINKKMAVIVLDQVIGGDTLDSYPESATSVEPYDYDLVFNSVTISE